MKRKRFKEEQIIGILKEHDLGKFTPHLKETIPREKYSEFIDYIRALKMIDEVLLPRVRNERPSDDYIAAKTASKFLTPERILEELALEELPRRNHGQGNTALGASQDAKTNHRSA